MKKIIALCGKPTSGKDETAKIIAEYFGGVTVDDALPLRTATPLLFSGADQIDCYTQEGKKKKVEVLGELYEVRQLLGDVGELLERHFGEFYLPDQTMKRIAQMPHQPYFILPSVRKNQTRFYRDQGALVLEIVRDVPESPYAFDKYDATACHDIIDNRGDLDQLRREVARVMSEHMGDHHLAWAIDDKRL